MRIDARTENNDDGNYQAKFSDKSSDGCFEKDVDRPSIGMMNTYVRTILLRVPAFLPEHIQTVGTPCL